MTRRLRLLLLVAVLIATAVAVARSDPAAIARALAAMSWRWAAIAAVVNLIGIVIDAARLRVIVRAVGRLTMGNALRAQLMGIVGNVLFPFKLGEGARAFVLTQRHQLPIATALAMVVLDRVIDALVLPLFVIVASVVLPLPASVLRFRTWMMLALSAATALGIVIGRRLAHRHAAGTVPDAVGGTLDRIVAGMTVLGHRRRIAATIAASLASWIARALILWCMFRAFGLPLPVSAAVSVLVIVNLGIAVVATPGNLGTFELATAAALALWGVPSETALSVGITTHVVEIVPPVFIGLLVSVRSHHHVSAIAPSSPPSATGS
jgi:glycosyltransferase 2 family protein